MRKLLARLRAIRNPDLLHNELSEEFQFHVDMRIAELTARGIPEAEARRTAEQQFGSAMRIQEDSFHQRSDGPLTELFSDIRFGLRIMRRNQLRTAMLVTTLALGIGANTAVFSVIRSVLLRDLPFANPAELVTLHQADATTTGGVSYPNYLDWRSRSHSFSDMAVYGGDTSVLSTDGQSVRLNGAVVSANFFSVLGVAPLTGRTFRSEDDRWPGKDGQPAVLISEQLWRDRFGSSPGVSDQQLRLDGQQFRIIGVIPRRMAYPVQTEPLDYWVTVAVDANPGYYNGSIPTSRGFPRYDGVVARLRSESSAALATAELDLIAQRIAQEHPKASIMDRVRLTPTLQEMTATSRPLLLLLYAGVFCTLLVACANAATLMLAGAAARQKEFALRSALGARTQRLIRSLLTESTLISVAAGAAGTALAWWIIRAFTALAPAGTPRLEEVHLDPLVLGYTLLLSIATGVLSGLVPAMTAARVEVVSTLKGAHLRPRRRAAILITAQIALSMALTCGATVAASSFLRILRSPKGFEPTGLLTASISLPSDRYPMQSPRTAAYYATVLRDLRSLPGVESAALAQTLPLSGRNNGTSISVIGAQHRGKPQADLRFVDPAYFSTLRIPLTSGRNFTAADGNHAPPVVVVNQAFVRRYLADRPALGARIQLGWGGDDPKTVVGIAGDIRHDALSVSTEPEVYVPQAQFPNNQMHLVLRMTGDAAKLSSAIRSRAIAAEPGAVVERIRTVEDYLLLSAAPQRFLTGVLLLFAGSTLLLAAIGLYGVVSVSVRGRTFEFGVRMALGSTPAQLMTLVLRGGLTMAFAGVAGGTVLALAGTRLLRRWLFATSPTDPASLAAAGALLLLVSAIACLGPARRAAAGRPWISLRQG